MGIRLASLIERCEGVGGREGFCDGAVFGILVDSFDLMLINIPYLPASSLTVMFCKDFLPSSLR